LTALSNEDLREQNHSQGPFKEELFNMQKPCVMEQLRKRWVIVSVFLSQKHLSDCTRLILFRKSFVAILRCKNLK